MPNKNNLLRKKELKVLKSTIFRLFCYFSFFCQFWGSAGGRGDANYPNGNYSLDTSEGMLKIFPY